MKIHISEAMPLIYTLKMGRMLSFTGLIWFFGGGGYAFMLYVSCINMTTFYKTICRVLIVVRRRELHMPSQMYGKGIIALIYVISA